MGEIVRFLWRKTIPRMHVQKEWPVHFGLHRTEKGCCGNMLDVMGWLQGHMSVCTLGLASGLATRSFQIEYLSQQVLNVKYA